MPLFTGSQQQYYTNSLTYSGNGSATAFDFNADDNSASFSPLPATWINQKRFNDEIPTVEESKEFKSDLDKEIYNRNNNIVEQSKRMKAYLEEANDNASDEVPDLLAELKKNKTNAKPIKDSNRQMDSIPQPIASNDG